MTAQQQGWQPLAGIKVLDFLLAASFSEKIA